MVHYTNALHYENKELIYVVCTRNSDGRKASEQDVSKEVDAIVLF